MCSVLKLQVSPSLFSSLWNRLSNGKLATSFLLLNSSHCVWEGGNNSPALFRAVRSREHLVLLDSVVGPEFCHYAKESQRLGVYALTRTTVQKKRRRGQNMGQWMQSRVDRGRPTRSICLKRFFCVCPPPLFSLLYFLSLFISDVIHVMILMENSKKDTPK